MQFHNNFNNKFIFAYKYFILKFILKISINTEKKIKFIKL